MVANTMFPTPSSSSNQKLQNSRVLYEIIKCDIYKPPESDSDSLSTLIWLLLPVIRA